MHTAHEIEEPAFHMLVNRGAEVVSDDGTITTFALRDGRCVFYLHDGSEWRFYMISS